MSAAFWVATGYFCVRAKPDVGDRGGADELDALVAMRAPVEVIEEALAASEQDRHDRHVHLVDDITRTL